MRKYLIPILLSGFLLAACQESTQVTGEEKSVEEIKQEGKIRNADIIRNPVSANQPQDTVNVAKIVFDKHVYDFGTVTEETVVEHTFSFTNTGTVPLLISNARSTCGCTVPNWPKEPIGAGEKGEIKVVFKTKGKKGMQKKPVTITANTYPKRSIIHIQGQVTPKRKN